MSWTTAFISVEEIIIEADFRCALFFFSCVETNGDPAALGASTAVSSRKLQAGTSRGELGRASDTRRCFKVSWEPVEFVVVVDEFVVAVPASAAAGVVFVCAGLSVVGAVDSVGG